MCESGLVIAACEHSSILSLTHILPITMCLPLPIPLPPLVVAAAAAALVDRTLSLEHQHISGVDSQCVQHCEAYAIKGSKPKHRQRTAPATDTMSTITTAAQKTEVTRDEA
jgi:hypothetical protein